MSHVYCTNNNESHVLQLIHARHANWRVPSADLDPGGYCVTTGHASDRDRVRSGGFLGCMLPSPRCPRCKWRSFDQYRLTDFDFRAAQSAAARKMQHLTPSGIQKPLQPIHAMQAVAPAANTTQAVAPAVHDEDIGSTLERLDTIQQEDGPSKSTMRANSPLRMEDDVVELSADVFNMNTSSSTRVSFIVHILPERFSSICCSNGSPE